MLDEDPALEDRVEHLEEGQNKILAKLDDLLGGVHDKAAEHTEERLGRPATIEEQVKAELERRDAEAAAKKAKEEEKSEQQSLREMLAKLTEAKPVQPQPRRQRLMWGKR